MYYYEHTNGQIIEKPDYLVETWGPAAEYFDSHVCVRWWHDSDSKKAGKKND